MVLLVDAAVEESRTLDGEGEGVGGVKLEGVSGIAVEGGGGAVGSLLARHPDLTRDEVVDGHLSAAERAGGGEGRGRWSGGGGSAEVGGVGEVEDGTVGDGEGGKGRGGVECWGSGRLGLEEEAVVKGEGLGIGRDAEMRLDEGTDGCDCGGGGIGHRDALQAVAATDPEDHH